MNFSELSLEVTVALLGIISIASIGCITALYSWRRIAAEQKAIKNTEIKLTSDESWNDAYPHEKVRLASWLRSHGIKPDSYIGDFIRTCWSAWLGGRPASLTELHTLVARRERNYKATRLSAGIAGLLLVFGIMGTLSAVKPVLEKFQIQVAEQPVDPSQNQTENDQLNQNLDDGRDAAFVAKNADKVNLLIRNLGGAFLPSLLALFGTICVVTCRGIYSQALYKFTLELDRFAVDTLIPRYRIIPLSEQFESIKASMSQLTDTIAQRESNFENVVEKLDKLVAGIAPSLAGLDSAAKASMESVDALTKGSTSIADALNRHLGARSSIHRAIKGLDKTYTDVESWFKELACISETINKSNTTSKKQLNEAIIALAGFLNKSVQDFEENREKMIDAIDGLRSELNVIPDQIVNTGENATKQAIKAAVTANQDLQKKFFERNVSFLETVNTTIKSEVRKFDKVSASLSDQSAKIETSIESLNDVKNDIKKSIEAVSSVEVRDIKDVVEKTPSQVSPIDASVPEPVETPISDDEWDGADSEIPSDDDVQNHHEQTMPEDPNTLAVGNDAAKVEPENELTDNEPDKNEELADSQTTDTTKPSERNIDQKSNIHTDKSDGSPDEINTGENKPNDGSNPIGGDPAPKPSRRSWWPFSKR
jgi:ABC-type transporter Mla subunit MlaD